MTQPEEVTIDDEEFYQWKAVLRIPKNWTPESGVFIAVAPPGGIANFPAAVRGDKGFTPTIRKVNVTELAYYDPTPASGVWTLVTEGTATRAPVLDLDLELHAGAPGNTPTVNLLDAGDLDDGGSPTPEYIFKINSAGDGAELVAQKVGNMYWPTSIATATNASDDTALASVTIPAHSFAWRPRCHGQVILSPDGPDIQVDLVARLNSTTGDVVARGYGLSGGNEQVLALAAAPPAASATDFGEVASGSQVIYFRAEKIGSGADTYDTLAGKAVFSVEVAPIA